LFINSGFISYLVTCTWIQNWSGSGSYFIIFFLYKSQKFKSGGLVTNENSVFISNAFLNPLLYTLNIAYLMKEYKRKNCKKLGEKCPLTQSQANKLWENPSFPIQSASAILINTIWFTAFYASLIPLGMVFSLICLIYEYWIFKVFYLKNILLILFFPLV